MTLVPGNFNSFYRRLRILTLDNPYVHLQDPEVKSIFADLLALKARGYGPPHYPSTYMTFDSTDFVAWHHILCVVNRDDKLEVVAGLKHINLSRCDFYQLMPPYFGLTLKAKAERHELVFGNVIAIHRREGRELLFSSGFTMREDLRGTAESAIVKEAVVSLMYADSKALGTAPIIGVGVPRFKTEKLWAQAGYRVMTDGDQELPPFPLTTSENEPILLMKADTLSPWAAECYWRHKDLVDNRRVLGTRLRQAA